MGGSYPRTEAQIMKKTQRNIDRMLKGPVKEQARLDSMRESLDIPPSIAEKNAEKYVYTVKNRPTKRASAVKKDAAPRESRVVEVPGRGDVDVSQIDHPLEGCKLGDGNWMYEAEARMRAGKPGSDIPNYDEFSAGWDMKEKGETERAGDYLGFMSNISRKIEIEERTKSKINMNDVADISAAIEKVFGSDKAVRAFLDTEKATGFRGEYVFVEESGSGGGELVEAARNTFLKDTEEGGGTIAAYHADSGKILVNVSKITPGFVENGGLVHEGFHYAHEKEWGKEIRKIGKIKNTWKQNFFNEIEYHCEEAKVNIQTSRYLRQNGGGYTNLLIKKFSLNPDNINASVDKRVYHREEKKIPLMSIAHEIASFKEADPTIYSTYLESINRNKDVIGEGDVKLLNTAHENFYKSANPGENYLDCMNKVLKLGGANFSMPNGRSKDKVKLKKFSCLSLEERLIN